MMMADESDDCRDVVRYWQVLNSGYDCVFGSRFVKGGGVMIIPGSNFGSIAAPIYSFEFFFASNLTILRMPLKPTGAKSLKAAAHSFTAF